MFFPPFLKAIIKSVIEDRLRFPAILNWKNPTKQIEPPFIKHLHIAWPCTDMFTFSLILKTLKGKYYYYPCFAVEEASNLNSH